MQAVTDNGFDDSEAPPGAAEILEALSQRLDGFPASYYAIAAVDELTGELGRRAAKVLLEAVEAERLDDITRHHLETVARDVEVAAEPLLELRHALREHHGHARRILRTVLDASTKVAKAAPPPPRPLTPAEIVALWAHQGALVHEPTGLAKLDEATRGGPVYGERWFLLGAPDAGKTALLVQLLDTWARCDLAVGLLAADEDPDDILTRLAQRGGVQRADCERRSPEDLARIGDAVVPIRLYDRQWTIEAAGDDIASWAAQRGTRAILGLDSVQTVQCDSEISSRLPLNASDAVTERTRAIRDVARRHRLIAIATSEMSRAAYRSRAVDDRIEDLAAAKHSGAIEYVAKVILSLRSVKGETDLVQLSVAKNKHGPRLEGDDALHLRMDRDRQILVQTEHVPTNPKERNAERDGANAERVLVDAARAAVVLADKPGLGTREVRAAVRARGGGGRDRIEAALAALDDGLVIRRASKGKALHHYLEGTKLPPEVLAELDGRSRVRVLEARPPAEETPS